MQHPELRPSVHRSAASLAGFWHLAPRQTLSLFPATDRELRIAQGRVWLTSGEQHGAQGWPRSGDVVLRQGEVLRVPAGAHLVMESWPEADGAPVRFDFAVCAPAEIARLPLKNSRLQRDVVQPARDLGLAVSQAARALVRLVVGIVGLGDVFVSGRGRVLSALDGGMRP